MFSAGESDCCSDAARSIIVLRAGTKKKRVNVADTGREQREKESRHEPEETSREKKRSFSFSP